jgi:hypothetical protein
MENKPSVDPGILAPVALGLLSIVGIALVFFLGRANASRPAGEMTATETPFRYVYLGTEPGLSTLTPEPTPTPIFIEPPANTAAPDPGEPSFDTPPPDFPPLVTSTSSNPGFSDTAGCADVNPRLPVKRYRQSSANSMIPIMRSYMRVNGPARPM